MPALPLLRAKLKIPPGRSGAISRPHLMRRLREALSCKLSLVSAPAGYGKTTLLAAFAAQVEVPLVWYTLDEGDNDPVIFFNYLIAGIQALCPSLGTSARNLLDDPSTAVRTEWITNLLLNALSTARTPQILILDDYHTITSPDIHSVMEHFLRHLPPHLHLILGTRTSPPLPLPRLRAQGQLLEMQAEALRFTLTETEQLLRTLPYATSALTSAAQTLQERTEGWPVGVQLASASLRQRDPQQWPTFLRQFSGTLRPIFDYLADEVYAGQPAYLRTFLAQSTILRDLSPALCDAVLDIQNSREILNLLMRMNLFIRQLDTARESYRYHDLFRKFLSQRLQEDTDPKSIQHLHLRAAAWFLEQGNDDRAVEHLLAAGDYETALDLFHSLREQLFFTSRYHLLKRWLARFPAAIKEKHPWLLLTRARLAHLRGDWSQADQLYQEVEPHLLGAQAPHLPESQEEHAKIYVLSHDRGEIAKGRGDFEKAETFYQRAFEYAVDDVQRAVALGQMARCAYMQGKDVEDALGKLNAAVALAEKSGHLLGRAGLLALKGKMLSSLGDFVGALAAWHTALDLMEAFDNRHQQISILSNAAYLHSLLGNFEETEVLLDRALELTQSFERPVQRAYALNIRGNLHRMREEWEAAQRCHEQALRIQKRVNERYEIPTTLNWLALLARRQGRLHEALRWGEEGLALRESQGNEYEIGLSLIDVGAIHLALDYPDTAEAMWQRALDIFTRHAARYEQIQLHTYLAVLAWHQADQEAVRTHLEQVMNLAHIYENSAAPPCLHFFSAEATWLAPVLADALRREKVPECVPYLLPQLGKPALEALLPLLDDPAPAIRTYAARLLGRLGNASALRPLYEHRKDPEKEVRQAIEGAQTKLLSTPPAPLRVQTLGGFRLWCGEREITDWPRQSARSVFLLLLLKYPQPVAANTLAEVLWPGATPEKASLNLRRAISDLRSTLDPELPPRAPSRYVTNLSESYRIDLPAGSYVEDRVFEEALSEALKPPSNTIVALEAAIESYAGDYLPDIPFEDWALARREHLRHLLLRGVHRLAQRYLAEERCEDAISAAHIAMTYEPWDEEATLILMQAYAAHGHLSAALRAYESLRERLQADLDLPPRDDLITLYQHLRQRRRGDEE